jgi:NAD(P)-dependent dehydrogenase (short-subunit alcohol dehydrogenase family)
VLNPFKPSPIAHPVRRGWFGGWVAWIWIPLLGAVLQGCGADGSSGRSRPLDPERTPVALVTGSTDGLGRALALELGSRGMHVIVHGRNEVRGAEVVAAIRAQGRGTAEFIAADYASLDQVRELALTILATHRRIDLLVNNAGIGPGAPGHERGVTPDGHEVRFQVNYLAGFLLTEALVPLLISTAQAGHEVRIIQITSRNQQPLDFEDLGTTEGYSGSLAYGRSKLAQILMTADLASRLAPYGVRAHSVHPAPAMDTGLVAETGSTPQSTVAEGLISVLNALENADAPSGTFFFEREPRAPHPQADDAEARARLRALSLEFVTPIPGAEGRGPGQ